VISTFAAVESVKMKAVPTGGFLALAEIAVGCLPTRNRLCVTCAFEILGRGGDEAGGGEGVLASVLNMASLEVAVPSGEVRTSLM